jgi:hypothetical protein
VRSISSSSSRFLLNCEFNFGRATDIIEPRDEDAYGDDCGGTQLSLGANRLSSNVALLAQTTKSPGNSESATAAADNDKERNYFMVGFS